MTSVEDAIQHEENRPAAYVLSPVDGTYMYKGACRNLLKRLKDHHAGRVRHTKNKRPLKLVYREYCRDFTQARKRENFFKTGAGRRFIQKQIDACVAEWPHATDFRPRAGQPGMIPPPRGSARG